MDPISSTSPFTILLRQRLMERAKLAAKSETARTAEIGSPQLASTLALSALIASKGLDDHDTHRALVEHLLATGFGDQMLNQAKFQQLIEQDTHTMEADPELSRLMTQVLRSLG